MEVVRKKEIIMIQHFHNICDYNIIIYDTSLRPLYSKTDNTTYPLLYSEGTIPVCLIKARRNVLME